LLWLEERKKNGRQVRLRFWHQLLLFILASFFMGAAVFGAYPTYETKGVWEWNDPRNIMFAAFYRPVWTFGVAIIWCVSTLLQTYFVALLTQFASLLTFQSYLGWLNNILSYSLWVPLARLTFRCEFFSEFFLSLELASNSRSHCNSAYLWHPIVMVISYAASKTFVEYDIWNIGLRFFGYSIITYLLALLIFLTVERPLMNLEKLLIPHRASK